MSKKVKFLEEEMIFDSDSTTKSILANRVDEIKLGYEQEKVEPEKILPNTNFLGVPDKFKAYVNEVGGPEYIGSPSFSAGKEEIQAFYLGGTFIANTCEKMLTQDPRTVLKIPKSVEEVLKSMDLSITLSDTTVKEIIPVEDLDGWDDEIDVSEWEKPIDPVSIGQKEVKVVEGEWIILNGGAVYSGNMKCELIIKFVPENLEDFQEIIIDLKPEVKEKDPYDLMTGLFSYWSLGNTSSFDGTDLSGNERVLKQASGRSMAISTEGLFGSCVYATNRDAGSYNSNKTIFQSNKSWSVSVWFKAIEINEESRSIIRGSASGNATGYIGIGLKNGVMCIISSTKNTPYYISEKEGITVDSKWHNFVLAHDVETRMIKLYQDGQEAGSWDSSNWNYTTNYNSDYSCNIAYTPYSAQDDCALGYYDEIALWDERSITQAEVTALWNNGAGLPFEDWSDE